jgi:large subunit ribosomal protein L16
VIRPGRILFEMEGVTEEIAREALRLAQMKLSVASMFVSRTPPEE